jgi:hypothetical protein
MFAINSRTVLHEAAEKKAEKPKAQKRAEKEQEDWNFSVRFKLKKDKQASLISIS